MAVKQYIVDGKTYNVSDNREQEFLAKFPNAELVGKPQGSSESATEESNQAQTKGGKLIEDLESSLDSGSLDSVDEITKLRRESFQATEEQEAEISAQADAELATLRNADSFDAAKVEKQQTEDMGAGDALGLLWTGFTDMFTSETKTPEQQKAEETVAARKERVAKLDKQAYDNLYNNLPEGEKPKKEDADGNETEEYTAWKQSITQEELDTEVKAVMSEESRDKVWFENFEEGMEELGAIEDRAALGMRQSGLFRSTWQEASEEKAKQAKIALDAETAKFVDTQKNLQLGMEELGDKYDKFSEHQKELSAINDKVNKLTSAEYTDQESYNKAVEEVNRLKGEFQALQEKYKDEGGLSYEELEREKNGYLTANDTLQDRYKDLQVKEEDLADYLDAVGRNYGWAANLYMGLGKGVTQLAGGLVSLADMASDMQKDAMEYVIDKAPESMKPFAYAGAAGVSLATGPFGTNAIQEIIQEKVTGEEDAKGGFDRLADAIWSADEALSNNMEKPGEFKDISNAEDFGEWFGNLVTTQAANTAVTFGTGGASLFILGASSAGSKYHDLEEEMKGYAELPEGHPMHNFKYSKLQQYSSAILSGTFEGLSEKVTLGQAKYVKGMMSGATPMKRGFNNFLKRNFFSKSGLYKNIYDPVEEGFSESLAELGNNITDRFVLGKDVSLLQGMDESFMSGLFMSGVVYKSPLIGKNMVKAFQSSDATAEIESISQQIQRKTELLNTVELSPENKAAVEAEIGALVQEHTVLVNETINGVQNMDGETRSDLINIDVELARLRQANKDAEADPALSPSQVAELQASNNNRASNLKATKDQLIAKANKVENMDQIERSTTKAQKDIEKITGKPIKFFKADKKTASEQAEAFRKADLDFIEQQLESKRKALENADGAARAEIQRDINKLESQKNQVENYSVDDMGQAQGFESPVTGNIFINTELSAETGGLNVVNHELMHTVLKKTLADNPRAALAMGKAVDDYLANLDPADVESSVMAARIRQYQNEPSAVRAEEKMTLFLDAMATGDIKIKRTGNQKLGDAMRRVMQSAGLRDVQLNTAEDVFNFITDFQASRKSIFFNKGIAKAAREGVQVGEGLLSTVTDAQVQEALDETAGDVKRSSMADVTDQVNDLGGAMGWTNETWKEAGGNFALQTMKAEGMLDRLIAAKLKVPMNPADTREFIDKVYAELASHVTNFNPEVNDSLFGWVNSQIANKAGNVYNREYKVTEESRAVDIDATTSDGAPVVQIEADTQSDMDRIDEITLSDMVHKDEAAKDRYSKLRRDIGLTPEMMQTVRDAVAKTFGTKLPDVDNKKFKDELQKAFRRELKKPIQDLMGTRGDFEFFLADNFDAIFDALPVSTLVQMERNLDPSKRLFTESRRVTKPTEVDQLISEGKLPKDTNRLSGPQLHTKKPTPTTEQVLAYFRGKNMEDILGYKIGASTLGTRKDKLAMEIGVELAFDATSEVIQQPEVRERRKGILELQGLEMAENDLAMVGKAIDRDPGIKFSKAAMPGLLFSRAVNQENLPNYFAKFDQVLDASRNGELDLRQVKDVKAKLKEIYGSELSAKEILNTAKKISKYAIEYDNIENKSEAFATKDIAVEEFVKFMSEQDVQDKGIADLLSEVMPEGFTSIAGLFNEKQRVNKARSAARGLFEQLQEKHGREKAVQMMVMLKGQYASSAKIGDGRFEVVDGVVVDKGGKRGTNRGQVFQSAGDYFDFLGITQDETRAVKKSRKNFAEKSSNGIKDQDYDGRLAQAEEAREATMAVTEYYLEQIKESAMDYGDLAMLTRMFGSNMNAPMKRAANLAYVAVGVENMDLKKAGSEMEYEHMVPTNAKIFQMIDTYMREGGLPSDFWSDYEVAIIPKTMDKGLIANGLRDGSVEGPFKIDEQNWRRYYNKLMFGEDVVAIRHIKTGEIIGQEFVDANNLIRAKNINQKGAKLIEQAALRFSKPADIVPRGMSTFDFDETLIIHGENFITATKGDQTLKISSDQWPVKGPGLAQDGWDFDFSDFAQVRGGQEGPFLDKMRERIRDFGAKDVFVLTARQQEAAVPIHEWLKSKGINLPVENITGLGDSRGEAKGEWMLEKFNEGYNDMYFVDDAFSNVKAVQDVFDQFDIKGRTVQARIKFSQTASAEFNNILEQVKGMPAAKQISAAQASIIGRSKGRFRFFVPPSAEDFKGLLYNFLGKGKQGDAQMQFFKESLLDPFADGIRKLNSYRQRMSEDYAALKKASKPVVKRFKKPIGVGKYTTEQAIRAWLWSANGIEVPGVNKAELDQLTAAVNADPELAAFAMALGNVSRQAEGYVKPTEFWTAGSIGQDLADATKGARAQFLAEWKANADQIFSPENMNKIEAIYGTRFREALEDILYRMEKGTNRPKGQDREVNSFLNWINGSVGTVMFFNTRSALLQTLSTVNFINFEDNNIFKAAKAFANQPQFWKDFAMLYNSDMLKQRRAGTKIDVNAAELSAAAQAAGGKVEAVIAKLLDIGFTPTQIADSFAIALGGSTYYRNRVNKYLQQGMTRAEAEEQAFEDFQEIAEETQQSSRPDLISKQQAGTLGRLILAWQNTPMQMTRLTKKALSDIVNGRGDLKANVSRVLYYGAMQNVMFGALQSGLMFALFGDEEDEEDEARKGNRVANGVLDSLLRGTGIYGAAAATLKNVILKWAEEHDKGFGKQDWSKVGQEIINLSPPMGSKFRKIMNAIKTYEYNEDAIDKMDWSPNNPAWNVFGNVVEATANIPLARLMNKASNIELAMQEGLEPWQRAALVLGWSKWDVGVEDEELQEAREEVREERAAASEQRREERNEERRREREEANASEVEANEAEIARQRQDGTPEEELQCAHIKPNGERCSNKPLPGKSFCTIHERVPQANEEKQCKHVKPNGKRCKMMTKNKSGLCYYHD